MKNRIQLSDHFTYSKLFRFVLPSVIMMLFTSIYGVVDGLFVSNFVGKTAFASINLVMPFLMILGGVGFMVGTGGSALVAKTLGEGNKKDARRYFTMMIILTVILGLTVTVIGMIFMPQISKLLGAKSEMMDDCVTYGRIIIGFNIAFMLQNVFQSFLVTAEKPKLGLFVTVAAGCTNMVLDALFIAVFKWGVAGAAVATGLSQAVGGIIPLVYFINKKNSSLLHTVKTRLEFKPIIKACANGSSELMSNISMSLVSMIYNFQLMRLVGEDGVSAYGVLMYVQFIFVSLSIGYSIGCAPVVGYHYGAGNTDELKSMLKKSITVTALSGVALTVLALVLADTFSKIFVGYDSGLYDLTRHAFSLFAYSFLLAGFNIFMSSFFTALNNGAVSAAISFLRTLLFQTSCVLILPIFFGVDGIWWAITVSEVFASIISVIFLFAKRKKYNYM